MIFNKLGATRLHSMPWRTCRSVRHGVIQHYEIHINTSSAGFLETCPTADRRPTVHSWISARYTRTPTSNAKRWAPGRMFSSIRYQQFVQVSSNQKHIFRMLFDVLLHKHSLLADFKWPISVKHLWTHANAECINNYSTTFFTEIEHIMQRFDYFCLSINIFFGSKLLLQPCFRCCFTSIRSWQISNYLLV